MQKPSSLIFLSCISHLIFCMCCNHASQDKINSLNVNDIPKIKPQYDSVKVFVYDGSLEQEIITKDFKIDSTVVCELKLNKEQEKQLNSLLKGEIKPTNDTICEVAGCFIPHYGIVYFNNGKPLQWCSICFTCNVSKENMSINACPAQLLPFFENLNLSKNKINFSKFLNDLHKNDSIIISLNEKKYGADYQKKRGF